MKLGPRIHIAVIELAHRLDATLHHVSSIAVAGDSLQINSGLPAATVNVLMGLVLVAVMGGWGLRKKAVVA